MSSKVLGTKRKASDHEGPISQKKCRVHRSRILDVFNSEVMLGILEHCRMNDWENLVKVHPDINATMNSHTFVAKRLSNMRLGLKGLLALKNIQDIKFWLSKQDKFSASHSQMLLRTLSLSEDQSFRSGLSDLILWIPQYFGPDTIPTLLFATLMFEQHDTLRSLLEVFNDSNTIGSSLALACLLNSSEAWNIVKDTWHSRPDYKIVISVWVHSMLNFVLCGTPRLLGKCPFQFLREDVFSQFYPLFVNYVTKLIPGLSHLEVYFYSNNL